MGRQRDPTLPLGLVVGLILASEGCVARTPSIRAGNSATSVAAEDDPDTVVVRLLRAHNAIRDGAGLAPFQPDPRLDAAARVHAQDMATRDRLSHRGGDRSSPFQRMEAAGYRYRRAAENIAWGQSSVESVMRGWMSSPPHRRNILGPYTQFGAARAVAPGGRPYWCVTFGTAFEP